MTGMTGMMTISKGFGLVAALAVSGTALFLAYGYKKRTVLNIRKGKGSLKYVHHLSEPRKKDGGISAELSNGKENGKGGVHLPQMSRRAQRSTRSSVRTHESTQEEQLINEKRVNCPDAELISCLQEEARSSFRDANKFVEQLDNVSDTSSLKSADLPDRLDNLHKGAENPSGESTPVSGGRMEGFARTADFDVPPSSSPFSFQEGQSSKSISVAPLPPKFALVGCFISSGSGANGKTGRQKKQVRFSPSVMEPSSNNHDYRRRGGQQRGGAQTTSHEQSSAAIGTIAHARPRLYSQAAKQTITYNIGRFDYRYSSRAYHPGHL